MTLTPHHFLAYEPKPSYSEIIKHANVGPTGLLRFLHGVAEEKSLNDFTMKRKNLENYTRPKDRDKKWHDKDYFLSHQLWLQDSEEGGIAGCV